MPDLLLLFAKQVVYQLHLMVMVTTTSRGLGNNEVTLTDGLLFVRLRGPQTSALAQRTLDAFRQQIGTMKAAGKKVYVLVDYSELEKIDVTVEARLAVKQAFGESYDSLAAIGSSHMADVALYLMQVGGAKHRARHFTSEKKARLWLAQQQRPQQVRNTIVLTASLITGLVGGLALLGWIVDNRALMGFITDLRPINPLGAIGLLIASLALFCLWRSWWIVAQLAGVLLVALGGAALLPIAIDNVLFTAQIQAMEGHTKLADLAGIGFIAGGLAIATAHHNGAVMRRIRWVLCGLVLAVSLFNMVALLYAQEYMYGVSDSFAMAFNLALGINVLGAGLMSMLTFERQGDVMSKVSRVGWLIVVALISVQIVTYASWQQAISRNRADANSAFEIRAKELDSELQGRVRAYIDSLYGFKGLFAASDTVLEKDFNAYHGDLDLAKKYPGIRAVSYISLVETKDLAVYTAERRADTSVSAANKNFTVQQLSPGSNQHYILTYLANSPNRGSLGRDFTEDTVRYATYQQALRSGLPAVSDTLTFAATDTLPASKGFFITIPIPAHPGQSPGQRGNGTHIGFVSAVFNYSDFFTNTFSNSSLLKDIDIDILDTTTGSNLFLSDMVKGRETSLSYNERVPVADRTWTIAVRATGNFGNSDTQAVLPRSLLFGGQAISLLLIAVFWLQNRSRQHAIELADSMTADLQRERNEAITIRQKDDAILSSIGDAVFAIDTAQKITLFNPAAEEISGFTAAEAIGKPYHQILQFQLEADSTVNNAFIKKALAGERATMESYTVLVTKSGDKIDVADSAAPIRDLSGSIIGAIVVFRDVSKENELDRAKTEFVSLASHQLRTPLSAINWYSEMLLNGDAGKVSEEQLTYLQEIYEGNQRMIELVNSLLDVSRLDLGKLSNAPESNNIVELINNLEKEMTVAIAAKKLTMTNDVDTALPPVIADPKLVRMIIQNLVSNAVKYTDAAGTVTVTARQASARDLTAAGLGAATTNHLYLSVKDNGYGIPVAQQSKIFSKLFRADNVRALDVEGTGLGLYIVREVVEKLGGKVWFESAEGAGSTFYVVMPFVTKGSGTAEETPPSAQESNV
jgi:PAS domain S-box-containing protein